MYLSYNKESSIVAYHKIEMYHAKDHYVMVGFNKNKDTMGIIKIGIDKTFHMDQRKYQLDKLIKEEVYTYNEAQLKDYKEKERLLDLKMNCSGIIGFVRFLAGYYLIMIINSTTISKLQQHKIKKIEDTKIIPLFDPNVVPQKIRNFEEKYKKMFMDFDLTLGFYFSPSYDLTNPLSKNFLINSGSSSNVFFPEDNEYHYSHGARIDNYCEIYTWNQNLLSEFYQCVTNKRWIMPIIHGYIEQMRFKLYAKSYSLTLISRRQRHHAGARYLKRGMNEKGFVANYVETEQIIIDLESGKEHSPTCSSFLQIRGSVPVYWFQQPHVYLPKPQIQINYSDPYYIGTKKHFMDLLTRYGDQIFLINLMKLGENIPREKILGDEYMKAFDYVHEEIGDDVLLKYIPFDMKNYLKRDKEDFFEKMSRLAFYAIMKTGMFSILKKLRYKKEKIIEFQRGIIRTNCVDCLDRTNFFQQIVGETALGIQIAKLNKERVNNIVEIDKYILRAYRGMYQRQGDVLSIQYGGSIAHKQSNLESQQHTFEFMTSIKRHFSNSFTDQQKQQSMDIFLGLFKPYLDCPHLWEMTPIITFGPNLNPDIEKRLDNPYWWRVALKTFERQFELEKFKKLKRRDASKELKKFQSEFFLLSAQIPKLSQKKNSMILRPSKSLTNVNNSQSEASPSNLLGNYRFVISSEKKFQRRKNYRLEAHSIKSLEKKIRKPYNHIIYPSLAEYTKGQISDDSDESELVLERNEHSTTVNFAINPNQKNAEDYELLKDYLNLKSIHHFHQKEVVSDLRSSVVYEPKTTRKEMELYVNFEFDCDIMDQSWMLNSVKDENMDEFLKWKKTNPTSQAVDQKQHTGVKRANKRTSHIDQHKVKLLEQSMKKNFSTSHKTKILKI